MSPVSIEIDGSHGEGGGQVLRTALALSCITGRPFHLFNIRRGRPRPGLQPRHLAAVRAASRIETRTVSSAGPGTYLMLRGRWQGAVAGFCALGAPGKRAETVGEEAAQAFLEHAATEAPVDPNLADQLVPYLAAADGVSEFTTSCITRHLLTNLWTVERFLERGYEVLGEEGGPGRVRIAGAGCAAGSAQSR